MKKAFLINDGHQLAIVSQVLDVLVETKDGHFLCASREGKEVHLYATDEDKIRSVVSKDLTSPNPCDCIMANVVLQLMNDNNINKLELGELL